MLTSIVRVLPRPVLIADRGFSCTPVLVIAGSLHVAGFLLILATGRSLQPLPLQPQYLTA